jgi:hypothetical protein
MQQNPLVLASYSIIFRFAEHMSLRLLVAVVQVAAVRVLEYAFLNRKDNICADVTGKKGQFFCNT